MQLPATTRSNWVDEVRSIYEEGGTDAEACKIMQITSDEFQNLCDVNPKFKRFVDLGNMMAKAWWLEIGRKNLSSRSFSTPLFLSYMKNRFGWTEKVETTDLTANLDSKSHDQITRDFNRLLNSLIGQKGDAASIQKLMTHEAVVE